MLIILYICTPIALFNRTLLLVASKPWPSTWRNYQKTKVLTLLPYKISVSLFHVPYVFFINEGSTELSHVCLFPKSSELARLDTN